MLKEGSISQVEGEGYTARRRSISYVRGERYTVWGGEDIPYGDGRG